MTVHAQLQSAPRGVKTSALRCPGVSDPRGSTASSGPQRDADRLRRLIWDHQEVQRLGFPTLHQLQTMSTWTWPRFVKTLDGLLEDPESGVYITNSGGLGYTWELTERDLELCRERVEKLREARHAR